MTQGPGGSLGGPLDDPSVTNGYDQFLRRTNLVSLLQRSFGFDATSRLQF